MPREVEARREDGRGGGSRRAELWQRLCRLCIVVVVVVAVVVAGLVVVDLSQVQGLSIKLKSLAKETRRDEA